MTYRNAFGARVPRASGVVLALVLSFIAACGGDNRSTHDTTTAQAPATPSAVTAGSGALSEPLPGAAPEGATSQMVALGDSIFHGQTGGGTCFTCHGMDAKGTALAPPLVPHKWLTGTGTYEFIQQRVTTGMPTPTPPYSAAMPPMGGAQFTPDQVKAVAAYVYSISR